MSDLQLLRALLTVAEIAAASVLVPPTAWLLAKAWRRSAASRRLVWVTAFAMLLAMPLLALVAPSLAVITLPPAPPAPAVLQAPVPAPEAPAAGSGFGWFDLIPLAGLIWLAGVAKLAAEHLLALVRLELMRRNAIAWPLPIPVPAPGCQLLVSEDCPGPMTWGVLRPVIMLPDEALDWPWERLVTVLRHETAHVRRRDGLAQALALLACALYWPNPLVWGAARALRRECELAADDAVIASGMRPSDYAGQLLELAAEWRERRLTTTGLAMAAPPALSQRVQSILSTDAIRTGATPMDTLKLALLGGVATAALVLARPSVAEIPTPSEPNLAATQPDEVRPAAPAEAGRVPTRPPSLDARHHRKPAIEPRPAGPEDGVDAGPNIQFAELSFRLVPAEARAELRADLQAAPPAPPADAAAPVPPATALPPAPPQVGPNTFYFRVNPRFRNGRAMTPEQRAELDRKMAEIGPAIDKALKDAHIEEKVQQALSAQDAKTREAVIKQLQELGPRIQRSIAGAQFQFRLAQLDPQMEANMREQRRQAQERQAQAEDRVAAQLEEQAKRARERAQRAREQLKELQSAPQPAPTPKN
ncbi:MAG: M56 family metallopeptidase [Caulobacteraceae bacterium]